VGRKLDTRGSGLTVIKRKIYMNAIEVACKTVKKIKSQEYETIQRQVAILMKVTQSPNIIRFYGLSEIDGNTVMVLEWAELGNLKELYERKNEKIPFELKVRPLKL
jgi:serine/threonine protein kinase